MKKYKEVTKTFTKTVLDELSCDICGKVADRADWAKCGSYDINEVEIKVIVKQIEGINYPEGGSGTAYNIDICPQCFKKVLIPFLRSKGAIIEETEWGW